MNNGKDEMLLFSPSAAEEGGEAEHGEKCDEEEERPEGQWHDPCAPGDDLAVGPLVHVTDGLLILRNEPGGQMGADEAEVVVV